MPHSCEYLFFDYPITGKTTEILFLPFYTKINITIFHHQLEMASWIGTGFWSFILKDQFSRHPKACLETQLRFHLQFYAFNSFIISVRESEDLLLERVCSATDAWF